MWLSYWIPLIYIEFPVVFEDLRIKLINHNKILKTLMGGGGDGQTCLERLICTIQKAWFNANTQPDISL